MAIGYWPLAFLNFYFLLLTDMQWIAASKIFTGDQWLYDHAVGIENGKIISVVPAANQQDLEFYKGHMLVPAFIDAQVYGAAGKLFSVFPEASTLSLMHEVFSREGTVLFQPTAATNSYAVFKKCIDAVKDYWSQGGRGVHGLHLEGPWIHPDKRGAHVKEHIVQPDVVAVTELLDYGKDVITMITLAPEQCTSDIIELIRSRGIVVSAGHSTADYQEAMNGFSNGIEAVTHLFNAMSALHHREPGLPGASMLHPTVKASIIPDGYHVDYGMIALAKKMMGSRLFAITDAVTDTDSGPYRHVRAGDKYECNGVLSGSALSMHQAMLNLVHEAGLPPGEALAMCSLLPAQVMGCEQLYGRIAPGHSSAMLVLAEDLSLEKVLT